jgi:hypothetical protein
MFTACVPKAFPFAFGSVRVRASVSVLGRSLSRRSLETLLLSNRSFLHMKLLYLTQFFEIGHDRVGIVRVVVVG